MHTEINIWRSQHYVNSSEIPSSMFLSLLCTRITFTLLENRYDMWNELTILWNDLTIDWNDLTSDHGTK